MDITITSGALLLVLDWTIRLLALCWIPLRTTSAAARSWLLLIGFVPVFGLPLYLLLGHPWLSKQRIQRQADVSQAIREQQSAQADMRWEPGRTAGIATELAPLVQRLGDFMPLRANEIELLDSYRQSIQALVEAIDSADTRVHLLYYLMHDDAVGDAVCAALERAAARGVECRLLLDAVGAKRGLKRYAAPLRAAGVTVHDMLPGGLRWRRSGRADLRNHRKIAVVDDDLAFVGSQNLACAEFVPGYPNRELVACVKGPIVSHLEAVFASDWFLETGQALNVSPERSTCEAGMVAQLLPSGPAYPFPNARDTVQALIHLARRRLVLTTPYFVPDDTTLNALRLAALSGVDVQLILSWSNNQRLTSWAQRAYYRELLACGVKIALYRPHFLHAKHMSVDEDVVLLGSINLDIRSFALNAEIGLICYDRRTVQRMREIETDYLDNAEQIHLDAWLNRPAWRRSLEGIARLADSLM